jgi:hypothetical protein
MTSTTDYEDCVEYIRSKFGDELTTLCDVKEENIDIEKDLVIGWLLTRDDETIPGRILLKIHPIIYERIDDAGSRAEESDIILGYTTDSDDLCAYGYISDDKVLKKEKIVGILPAQSNTYYVRYHVYIEDIGDCVSFVIGVMHNPDTKEIIEIAKKKYYVWLKSYEFEQLIDKLKAKSKSKNNRELTDKQST